MCSNLKMDFDLAKANLLEINEALQFLHKYFKKVEKLEKEMDGDASALANLAEVKETTKRAKESMKKLQNKLTRNTRSANEGLNLLKHRLEKAIRSLGALCEKNEGLIRSRERYEKLRLKQSNLASPYSQQLMLNRQTKLEILKNQQEAVVATIRGVEIEKKVLEESCCTMETFLEDTQCTLQQMRKTRTTPTKEGIALLQWCSTLANSNPDVMSMFQEHGIDDTVVAFEYINPSDVPSNTPRLVLTVYFAKLKCTVRKYGIVDVKCNINSLDIASFVNVAIARNDIGHLLTCVHSAWTSHINMLIEVLALRGRFPVDWIGEMLQCRVLLGEQKNVVFTLSFPVGYPIRGRVEIEKIECNWNSVKKEDFESQGEGQELLDWIESLQAKVVAAARVGSNAK